MTKAELFNLIIDNKMKIFNRKNYNERLKVFLESYRIILPLPEITKETVYNYLLDLKEEDIQCQCNNCNNHVPLNSFSIGNRARNKYCSRDCYHKQRSIDQQGETNTLFRMTAETKKMWKENLSITLKKSIADGKFVPNITNSWAGSKCNVIINENKCETRSSWEALFYLANPTLKYEKIVIPYYYKDEWKNYIVDFVDYDNKILYEIKPDRVVNYNIIKVKIEYAIKWCDIHNYLYVIIGNDWFKHNYSKYKHLITGQPSEEKLKKLLKQFDEN